MAKIRKRRQSTAKAKALPEPGRAVLPESSRQINSRPRLHPQPARRPAPPVVSNEQVSAADVERRLMRAMKTIRVLPDHERRFLAGKLSSHSIIDVDPEDIIVEQYQPTPADVTDCLTALSWVRHMDRDDWNILWWRSFEASFFLIGKRIGRSDETARRYFARAIKDAWCTANKRQFH